MDTKKKRRWIGIYGRTLFSHMTLALAILIVVLALSYVIMESYILNMRMDDLTDKACQIALSIPDGRPSTENIRLYQGLLQVKMFYVERTDGKLRIWRLKEAQGEAASREDPMLGMDILGTLDQRFVGRIMKGENIRTRRKFEFTEGEVLFVGVPVVSGGAIEAGIILAQPVEQLFHLTRAIGLIVLGITSFSLLLAVLPARVLTRKLVDPVKRLTLAAQKMSDGVYAEPIGSLPNNEIGDLGQSMNVMAKKLIAMIHDLRKERDKLDLLIASIGEGLIGVDTQWNIVHSNAAFLELMELDDPNDLWRSDVSGTDTLRNLLERCMQTGEPQRVQWKNPSNRALTANASSISDENGALLGAVCLVRDTSEAMRLEQLRRDYVANISHELRTPLTGIRGMVEPLIDGCMVTEAERQDSYHVILKETLRLEKLVGEMLDMSRLQDGRVSIEVEPLELPGILASAARGMKRIAEDVGVKLRVETDGSPLACVGNEARITQVLVILMDNALSFTPAGGSVTVFARDAGSHVAVGVRDTGCGIEPKDLPMIWERFYKADRSRMRTTGTGLGLSIAKLIVELMGGEIGVVSSPGKGAEFTFTLLKQVPPNQ